MGCASPTHTANVPFFDLDPARPNEAYFAHLDWVIARAAQKGLYIGLLPTWGDKVNRMWGQGPQVFDQASARAYGAWIGRRYRQAANIIWILGGDRPESDADGHDYAPVVRAMAAGIQAGVGGPTLMTYHTNGGRSSSQAFHGDDWLDLNMWQSGHHQQDAPNWEMITADIQRTPLKPVLDGEPNYEDHPINPWPQWTPEKGYFRDHDVRKAAYRAVFAGACGHTYGHHSIWQFYDPQRREPVNHPWCDWRTALDRPGAFQVGLSAPPDGIAPLPHPHPRPAGVGGGARRGGRPCPRHARQPGQLFDGLPAAGATGKRAPGAAGRLHRARLVV